MTIKLGKVHKYMGMHLHVRLKGKLKVGMTDFIKEPISIWPKPVDVSVKTPAGGHLLKVNPDAEKLEEKRSKIFHTLTAINLFSSKRAWGDILP